MENIDSFDFFGKSVLVRVDFNVPMKQGRITDDTRIKAALPTLRKILNDQGRAIVISHLGRPNGVRKPESSLHTVSEHLKTLLPNPVFFCTSCVGKLPQETSKNLKNGEVLVLENLRFHKEEEEGNLFFAKKLSLLGDFFINDAFGSAHRNHASTAVIAQFFGDQKCFGYLMQKEVESINHILETTQRPVTAIIGGAKVSTKIPILTRMLDVVDHLIIGGGMIFTFIRALGGEIGTSICEESQLEIIKKTLYSGKRKKRSHPPAQRGSGGKKIRPTGKKKKVPAHKIPKKWMGMDVSKKSIKKIKPILENSRTILWNGPLGVFEFDRFAGGTEKIGRLISKATKDGAFSLVGGGDSVAAIKKFGIEDQFSFVSTGGGALLESLEGKRLPGVEAILQ